MTRCFLPSGTPGATTVEGNRPLFLGTTETRQVRRRAREAPASTISVMNHDTRIPADLAALVEETFVEAYADQLDRDELTRYAWKVLLPQLADELASGDVHVLYAHAEDRLVGYATVRRLEDPIGPLVRMDRLYVRPRHHRQGHGRRLMERALLAATSWGGTRLCLGVWERNDRALAFYRAMGFLSCGEETFEMDGAVQRDVILCRPVPDGDGTLVEPT
jgi:diamine N-acetyltransferase